MNRLCPTSSDVFVPLLPVRNRFPKFHRRKGFIKKFLSRPNFPRGRVDGARSCIPLRTTETPVSPPETRRLFGVECTSSPVPVTQSSI